MPQDSSYDAARHGAAIIDRSDRARIVISGSDRRSYLHGLLTNDITALSAGQGCYAAYLTPQGRMITDLWVYELGDVVLLSCGRDVKDTLASKLDQFVFSEDVQIEDATATFGHVAVVGPRAAIAAAAVVGVSETALAGLPEHGNLRAAFHGEPAIVLRVTDTGEPGYDLLVQMPHQGELLSHLHAAGAVDVDAQVADAIRIEAGIPKFHRDMDEETIPLEAGIESRALSFTKGCYVGQEVIIRVLHRGHGRVAKKLVGLTLHASLVPPPQAAVTVDGRDVGHVTSAVMSPALKRPVALAYLHRDYVEPGTHVAVDGSEAVVTALPFAQTQV
jgi:tRNA-modifying protein YgfZ